MIKAFFVCENFDMSQISPPKVLPARLIAEDWIIIDGCAFSVLSCWWKKEKTSAKNDELETWYLEVHLKKY